MEYPAYEDLIHSGIEWLGEIPHNWEVIKLGFIGDAIIGLTYEPSQVSNETDGILILRASNIQGAKLVNNNNIYVDATIPEKLILKLNDILICSRNGSRDLIGKNGRVDKQFIGCSFGAFNTVFRSQFNVYIYHVLNSSLFEYQSGSFLTSTINQLTIGTLNTFKIPFPPIKEQQKIASFLDYKTQQIDQLIEKKKALIEKLNEQRIAVITQAVTKGIDKNAKMKPSGVDWLGDVPDHWEVKRLRFVINTTKGYAFKSVNFTNNGVLVVKASDIKNKTIIKSDVYLPYMFLQTHSQVELHEGDIVISTVGSNPEVINSAVGQIGRVGKDCDGALLNQNTVILKPNIELENEYLLYLLSATAFREHLDLHAHGTANQASLSLVDILNFRAAIPSIVEQSQITNFLNRKTSILDGMTKTADNIIDRLEEYRSTLITAAVTGKIDVRNFEIPTH